MPTSPSNLESVTVDDLRVGDVIKHGSAMMRVEWINEFPKCRDIGLRWGDPVGFPYRTLKRRSTLVRREIRDAN